MKKLLSLIAIAGVMTACNDSSTHTDTTLSDTVSVAPPVETRVAPTDSTATMKDGLMTLKEGKMMVVKGGAWEALQEPVTCTNGRVVALNGEVSKGDKKRMLTEGMMIDKDGQMMDKDGKMLDNSGWE